eukprot:gnl/MRDRNA2_/MRDRNA2_99034_c0_seq1.p1 gnl/MRDRNA2_/MRDRNA2_99034_c0~~gnl/MRDRNA2_/MRDRNA2_99034_c0_seq1.p1  ORF type:complete len:3067 (-),score=761.59 gnl/MRDRNA2_/MRDRNA2_99034_c0_seq1:70-9270(-)
MVAPGPGSEWLNEGFGSRATLLPGVSDIVDDEERSTHFKSLAYACSEELRRLLKYNVRNRIAAHGAADGDVDYKNLEKVVGSALSEILNRLGAYFDHAMQTINQGIRKEEDSIESTILRKQLSGLVTHVSGLEKQLECSNVRNTNAGDMCRKMRRDWMVDQQQQRNRLKKVLGQHLVTMSEEEIDALLQRELDVSFFNVDEFLDVDSKDTLKRRAQELQNEFAVERRAMQKKINIQDRELEDTTDKLQKAEDRIHSLTIQLKTFKTINKGALKRDEQESSKAEEVSSDEDEDQGRSDVDKGNRPMRQQVVQYEMAVSDALSKTEAALPLIKQMQENINDVRPEVMLRELHSRFANITEGLRTSKMESYISDEQKETVLAKQEVETLKNQVFMTKQELDAMKEKVNSGSFSAPGNGALMPESEAIAKLQAEVARLRNSADEGKAAKRELRRLQEQRNSIDAGSLIGLKQEALEWEMVEQFELELADVKHALAQAEQSKAEVEATNHELQHLLEEAEERAVKHGAPETRRVTEALIKLQTCVGEAEEAEPLEIKAPRRSRVSSDLTNASSDTNAKEIGAEEKESTSRQHGASKSVLTTKPKMCTVETQTDIRDDQPAPQIVRQALPTKSFDFHGLSEDPISMPDAEVPQSNVKEIERHPDQIPEEEGVVDPVGESKPVSLQENTRRASGSGLQGPELANRSIDDWGETSMQIRARNIPQRPADRMENTEVTPSSTMRDSRGAGNSWAPGMGSTTGWRMREKVWLVKQKELLSKAVRRERQRLYRAWPRAASVDVSSRRSRFSAASAVDEVDQERLNPFLNSAEEIIGQMEEEAMFQRNEALSKVDSARLLSFCVTNKNNEIGEDPRNILECPELLEYYQCTELMYRRLLDQSQGMSNLQERCNAALFELDRKNTELCHLRQSFIERVSDEMLAWEVQRTWLRRCRGALDKAGLELDIPSQLLGSTCNRDDILNVIEQLVSQDENGKLSQKFEEQAERMKFRIAQDVERMREDYKQRSGDISSVLRKFRSELPKCAAGFLLNDDGTLFEGCNDGRQRSLSVQVLLTKLKEDADAGESHRHGEIFEVLLEREQRCIDLYREVGHEYGDRILKGERKAALEFMMWFDEVEQFWESQGMGAKPNPEEEDDSDDDYLESVMPVDVKAGCILRNVRHTVRNTVSLPRSHTWVPGDIMGDDLLDQIMENSDDEEESEEATRSRRRSQLLGRKTQVPAWLRQQNIAPDQDLEEMMGKDNSNDAQPVSDDAITSVESIRCKTHTARTSLLAAVGAIEVKDESGNLISLQESAVGPDMEDPSRERCKFTRKLPPLPGGISISTSVTDEISRPQEVVEITEEAEANALLQEVWVAETKRKSGKQSEKLKKAGANSNECSKKKLQMITNALDINKFRQPKIEKESVKVISSSKLQKLRKNTLSFPLSALKQAGDEAESDEDEGDHEISMRSENEISMRSETDVTCDDNDSDDEPTDSSAPRLQPKAKLAKLRAARATLKKSQTSINFKSSNSEDNSAGASNASKNFRKSLAKQVAQSRLSRFDKGSRKTKLLRSDDDEDSGSDGDSETSSSKSRLPKPVPKARGTRTKVLKRALTFAGMQGEPSKPGASPRAASPRMSTKPGRRRLGGKASQDIAAFEDDEDAEDDTVIEEEGDEDDDRNEDEEETYVEANAKHQTEEEPEQKTEENPTKVTKGRSRRRSSDEDEDSEGEDAKSTRYGGKTAQLRMPPRNKDLSSQLQGKVMEGKLQARQNVDRRQKAEHSSVTEEIEDEEAYDDTEEFETMPQEAPKARTSGDEDEIQVAKSGRPKKVSAEKRWQGYVEETAGMSDEEDDEDEGVRQWRPHRKTGFEGSMTDDDYEQSRAKALALRQKKKKKEKSQQESQEEDEDGQNVRSAGTGPNPSAVLKSPLLKKKLLRSKTRKVEEARESLEGKEGKEEGSRTPTFKKKVFRAKTKQIPDGEDSKDSAEEKQESSSKKKLIKGATKALRRKEQGGESAKQGQELTAWAAAKEAVQAAMATQQEGAVDSEWTSTLSASLVPLTRKSQCLLQRLNKFGFSGAKFDSTPALPELLDAIEKEMVEIEKAENENEEMRMRAKNVAQNGDDEESDDRTGNGDEEEEVDDEEMEDGDIEEAAENDKEDSESDSEYEDEAFVSNVQATAQRCNDKKKSLFTNVKEAISKGSHQDHEDANPEPNADEPKADALRFVSNAQLESLGIRAPTPPPPKVMKTQSVQTDAPVVNRDENTRRLKTKSGTFRAKTRFIMEAARAVKAAAAEQQIAESPKVQEEKMETKVTTQPVAEDPQAEDQQESLEVAGNSEEQHEEPVEVIDSSQQCESTWLKLPDEVITWLKLNLMQKQQAEHYYTDWSVSEFESFGEMDAARRDKIIKDFEYFLDNEMCMIRPTKHKVRRGLRKNKKATDGDEGDEEVEGDPAEIEAGNLKKTLAQTRLKAVIAASMNQDADNRTNQKTDAGVRVEEPSTMKLNGPRRGFVQGTRQTIQKGAEVALSNFASNKEFGPIFPPRSQPTPSAALQIEKPRLTVQPSKLEELKYRNNEVVGEGPGGTSDTKDPDGGRRYSGPSLLEGLLQQIDGETGGTQETSRVEMEVASGVDKMIRDIAPASPQLKKKGRRGRAITDSRLGRDSSLGSNAMEAYGLHSSLEGHGKSGSNIDPSVPNKKRIPGQPDSGLISAFLTKQTDRDCQLVSDAGPSASNKSRIPGHAATGPVMQNRQLITDASSLALAVGSDDAKLQMHRRELQALETMKNHRLPKPPMGMQDFLGQLHSVDREVKDLLALANSGDDGRFKEHLEPLKQFLSSVAKGKNTNFTGMTDDVLRIYSSLEDAGRAIHNQERTQHVNDALTVMQEVASKDEVRMQQLCLSGSNVANKNRQLEGSDSEEIEEVYDPVAVAMTRKAIAVPIIRRPQGSPPQESKGRQYALAKLREPAPTAPLSKRPSNAREGFVGCVAWSYAARNPDRGDHYVGEDQPDPAEGGAAQPTESAGMGWTNEGWHRKSSGAGSKTGILPDIQRSNSQGESPNGHPLDPSISPADGSRRSGIDCNMGPFTAR